MLDCVLCRPVDFDEAAVFMFKDPAKAALMQWDLHNTTELPSDCWPKLVNGKSLRDAAIHDTVQRLTQEFNDLRAPPSYKRPIGLQEVETVLCKWKSHMNGHYPLFNDTDEINEGMVNWLPHSEAAVTFAKAMVQRDPRR